MMTSRRRLRMAAALAVLAIVALGACQQPQEPESSTGAEPSSEVTTEVTTEPATEPSSEVATPPESDVEMPDFNDLMTEDSVDGAASAAWYFLRTWNYARATGDTTTFETLFADSCNWCAEQLDSVDGIYAAGGWIEGGQADFDIGTAMVEFPSEASDFYTVRVNAEVGSYAAHVPDLPPTEGEAESLAPIAVGVRYNGSGFTVVGVNYAVG